MNEVFACINFVMLCVVLWRLGELDSRVANTDTGMMKDLAQKVSYEYNKVMDRFIGLCDALDIRSVKTVSVNSTEFRKAVAEATRKAAKRTASKPTKAANRARK